MSTTGTAARLCASEVNQNGAIRVTSRLPSTILLIDTSRRVDQHECHSVDVPLMKISSTATQRLSQRGAPAGWWFSSYGGGEGTADSRSLRSADQRRSAKRSQ